MSTSRTPAPALVTVPETVAPRATVTGGAVATRPNATGTGVPPDWTVLPALPVLAQREVNPARPTFWIFPRYVRGRPGRESPPSLRTPLCAATSLRLS